MRLDSLTTTTLLVAMSLVPPLSAQNVDACDSSPQLSQRCNPTNYRFPVIDTAPVVSPLNQLRRVPVSPTQQVDAFPSPYPAALVRVTRVELTSETDEWVTVAIESIEHDVELSFTHRQATQAIYLEPGIYRLRFRPTLSNRPWQSGYIGVGRTNMLRILFNQESEQVVIFDDPDAWSPDGSLGFVNP